MRKVGSKGFLVTLLLVILAAAGIVVGYNEYLERTVEPDDGSYIVRQVPITREIEWLQQYVRIDTSGQNETEGARFLSGILTEHGIENEVIESAPGRGNVYARLKGKRPDEGLMLINHIDVVPADPSAWARPPFSGEIFNNTIYGRGVLDMKGIAIAQLAAFVAVAATGVQPERDLIFLATADEETGSEFGVRWLLEHRPDMFDGVRYALNEGGITQTVRNQVTFFGIEVGSLSSARFSARADEREPLEEFRRDLTAAFRPWSEVKFHDEAARQLAALAPSRVDGSDLLEDIKRTQDQGRLWRAAGSYRQLWSPTVAISGVRSEPDEAKFLLRGQLFAPPGSELSHLYERLEGLAGSRGAELFDVALLQTQVSSSSGAFYDLLVRSIHGLYGDQVTAGPMFLPAGALTDSHFLRAVGIEAFGMWPHPVDFFSTKAIHGRDEKLRLDWYLEGVELTRRIVQDYVSDKF